LRESSGMMLPILPLQIYCEVWGQRVNMDKSSIHFVKDARITSKMK
jgi:hypothetical protein